MTVRVKFLRDDEDYEFLSSNKKPRYSKGDVGIIHGYVSTASDVVYACVIVGDKIVSVRLNDIEVNQIDF